MGWSMRVLEEQYRARHQVSSPKRKRLFSPGFRKPVEEAAQLELDVLGL